MSFLLVGGYSYDNRYLVDFSYRIGASSLFGSDKRWSPGWSTGIGWNLHNEKWFENVETIKRLKIRGSIGQTGNLNFNTNEAVATYSYYTQLLYNGQAGAYLTALPNENLKIEQRFDVNAGADIEIGKATLSFDFWNGRTKDMITTVSVATSTGFTSVKDNLGLVRNRGIEASLGYSIFNNERGFLTLHGAIATENNYIISLSESMRTYNKLQETLAANQGNSSPVILYRDGQSMNTIWAVKSLGIDPKTGNEVYVKRDGSLTYQYDPNDLIAAGVSTPKFRGTFGFSGEYKRIGLAASFRFLGGGQMYNTTLVDRVENIDIRYNVDRRVLTGRWQTEGQNAQYKRLDGSTYADESGLQRQRVTQATTRFVQDRNELTFSSLNVYYKFDTSKIDWLKQLKLSFYMNDIFTLSTIKVERGLSYPFARYMSLSLSATF